MTLGYWAHPPFTEVSGFVLSALHGKTCASVCKGFWLQPPCPSHPHLCLPCSGETGVLLLSGPTTLPKICAYASRWGVNTYLLGVKVEAVTLTVVCAISLVSVSGGWKKAGSFTSQRNASHCCVLVWHQSENRSTFPLLSREALLPFQSIEAAFQLSPKLCLFG
jgi:hypothetical protein